MAIQINGEYKGFKCPEMYLKAMSVRIQVAVYKDEKARIDGDQPLDIEKVFVPITPAIYEELKVLYPEVIDILTDSWKEKPEVV